MFDTRADLLGALAATPDFLDALLGDLEPEVARAAPADAQHLGRVARAVREAPAMAPGDE